MNRISNFLCLFVLVFCLFSSCRKALNKNFDEIHKKSKEDIILITNHWFEGQLNGTQSQGKVEVLNKLKRSLNFEFLSVEPFKEKESLIVVPIESEDYKHNYKKQSVGSYLILILDKDGEIRKGNVLQTTSKLNGLPKGTVASIYKNQKSIVDGSFIVNSIFNEYVFEVTYNNGDLTKYSYMDNDKEKKRKSSFQSNSSESCIAWYLVTTYYYSDGSTEVTQEYLGYTCSTNGSDTCPPINPSLESAYCDQSGGGDPGSYAADLVSVDTISNQLTDTCLLAIINKITNAKLKNQITKLFQQTYIGYGQYVHLKLLQNSNLVDNVGDPLFAKSYLLQQNQEWDITLNDNFTDSSSREYMAAVILHELVHSFISMYKEQNGVPLTDFDQHQHIFERWVNQLRDAFVEIYGISSIDATALALQGMDDVLTQEVGPGQYSFKQKYIDFANTKYNMDLYNARAIFDQYKSGTKGTKCN